MPESKYLDLIKHNQIWSLLNSDNGDVIIGVYTGGQVYCHSLRNSMQFDQDTFVSRYYLKEDEMGNIVC